VSIGNDRHYRELTALDKKKGVNKNEKNRHCPSKGSNQGQRDKHP